MTWYDDPEDVVVFEVEDPFRECDEVDMMLIMCESARVRTERLSSAQRCGWTML